MQIKYIEKTPIATEFNMLTESVGWGTRENNIIEEALEIHYTHFVFTMAIT